MRQEQTNEHTWRNTQYTRTHTHTQTHTQKNNRSISGRFTFVSCCNINPHNQTNWPLDSIKLCHALLYIMKFLMIQFSPACCWFFILRPNNVIATILENPWSIFFFPYRERPSFTPTLNNRKNYSFLYFNLHVWRQQWGKQKILEWMVVGIPKINLLFNSSWMQFSCVNVVAKYCEMYHILEQEISYLKLQFWPVFCDRT